MLASMNTSGVKLSKLVLGPTFRVGLEESATQACDRLSHSIESRREFNVERVGEHFQITIPEERRHRWSPWLTLEIRGHDQDHDGDEDASEHFVAEAFGRFNPSPGIWTGYMLASLSLLTIAAGAAVWGVAEMMMNHPPRAFWGVPIALVVLVAMWAISAAGQKLAHDEMVEIQHAVEAALGDYS